MLEKESSPDEHSQPADDPAESSNAERDHSSPTPPEDNQPKVVYRREETSATTDQPNKVMSAVRTVLTQRLAPAIMPLIV
ncbi:MAG: hypothetical protein M3539_06400, partial [Acidobacteriota bacterium]|nr:hypothetical protein [Acidobacteriota bacterium]